MSDGPVLMQPGEAASYRTPFGDVMAFVTGESATDGTFSLHERVAPPGSMSPGHAHSRLIEAFYTLDGELQFEVGGEKIVAGAGTFVMARRGVRHGWRNATDRDARALVIFSPSAERAYFEELDALTRSAGTGRVDARKIVELSERFGWT